MKILDYQIRVTGRVPADVLEEIEAVQVTVQPMRTILRGSVPDQAATKQLDRVDFDRVQLLWRDVRGAEPPGVVLVGSRPGARRWALSPGYCAA